MNIQFDIYGVNEADHTAYVRFWTDLLSIDTLGCVRNEDGSIKESRTDLSIGIPLEVPIDKNDEAFRAFILQFAQRQWFEVLEAKLAGQVGPLTPLLGGAASFEQQVVREVQIRLDSFARTRGYDDIKSASDYADEDSVAQFQLEGRYARRMRSLTWAHCYQIMADVTAGTREVPSLEQILAELPALEWPA